jgi:hypothetical protein
MCEAGRSPEISGRQPGFVEGCGLGIRVSGLRAFDLLFGAILLCVLRRVLSASAKVDEFP